MFNELLLVVWKIFINSIDLIDYCNNSWKIRSEKNVTRAFYLNVMNLNIANYRGHTIIASNSSDY